MTKSTCRWCGGEIYEDEGCSSSVGLVHFDCAPEVQMDDRACEWDGSYDPYSGTGWDD
jgi:hypothetical protein